MIMTMKEKTYVVLHPCAEVLIPGLHHASTFCLKRTRKTYYVVTLDMNTKLYR